MAKLLKERDIIVNITIHGCMFVHNDTSTNASRVAMYIKVNTSYSIDTDIKFEISGFESLWINTENGIVSKLTVEVLCRHPVYDKDSIEKFIEGIENLHPK